MPDTIVKEDIEKMIVRHGLDTILKVIGKYACMVYFDLREANYDDGK